MTKRQEADLDRFTRRKSPPRGPVSPLYRVHPEGSEGCMVQRGVAPILIKIIGCRRCILCVCVCFVCFHEVLAGYRHSLLGDAFTEGSSAGKAGLRLGRFQDSCVSQPDPSCRATTQIADTSSEYTSPVKVVPYRQREPENIKQVTEKTKTIDLSF